jgi:hypothetical protein
MQMQPSRQTGLSLPLMTITKRAGSTFLIALFSDEKGEKGK